MEVLQLLSGFQEKKRRKKRLAGFMSCDRTYRKDEGRRGKSSLQIASNWSWVSQLEHPKTYTGGSVGGGGVCRFDRCIFLPNP